MTKEHLAKWLLEQSNVPLKFLKPVASRLGISTNYVGAALFAGQIVYENQEAIVKYADRGGVHVGEFLHARASERYGEDHPLTEYLRANVDALDEAFEGSEQEALTFAEFYRRLREVDRDTPDLGDPSALLTGVRDAVPDPRRAMPDPRRAVPDPRETVAGAKNAATGAKGAVVGTRDAVADNVPDVREAVGDSSSDSEEDAVEIPVSDSDGDSRAESE